MEISERNFWALITLIMRAVFNDDIAKKRYKKFQEDTSLWRKLMKN